MALRKSDLYGSIWQSCDELRGGMDASQYKDYILTLLFVKYVTDKAKSDPDSLIDVPQGGSYDDLVALKGSPEIGEGIDKAIAKLAEANELHGVIDVASFNDPEKLGSGKEMQDRLSKLVAIFADLDFRGSRAEGDDLLGDAYEYLMRNFATESGKSKGQFYTPAEVSRVMAKTVGIDEHTKQDDSVYDPTCGSGSLLIKAAAEAPRGITVYGQEKDNATWALSRMNMILHGDATADIAKGDTITSPKSVSGNKLKTFDFVVANPPFSQKSWSNGLEEDYGRFEYGMPPPKNGDYAFLLHALKSLKSTGKGVVVMPHGVLFRGNAEADIRRELLKRGFIKGIIGLPPNLFYGTGIAACLVVLDKKDATDKRSVFVIDASKGLIKDGAKNRLRSQDVHKIVDVFNKQSEVERYSRRVPYAEIEANDFNLNISRYIDSSDPEDIQDLEAHLHGGIPNRDIDALRPFWDAFPSLRQQLFTESREDYSDLAVPVSAVHQTILDSAEFQQFDADVRLRVAEWFAAHRGVLADIDETTKPNDVVAALGDDLLSRFQDVPLLDAYDVYEQLLSFWHETMHDDVFLVMKEGWIEGSRPRQPIVDKERKLTETPDLAIGSGKNAKKYKMDLLPPAIVAERHFSGQVSELAALEAAVTAASAAVEEFTEEQAVEDGLLWDAVEDDKVTKTLAAARLRQAKREGAEADELAALEHVISLFEADAAAKKVAKEARAALDKATLRQYSDLTADDVQDLVLADKWHATVSARVGEALQLSMLTLADRVATLGSRYRETVGSLDSEVEQLSRLVLKHLAAMGVS